MQLLICRLSDLLNEVWTPFVTRSRRLRPCNNLVIYATLNIHMMVVMI